MPEGFVLRESHVDRVLKKAVELEPSLKRNQDLLDEIAIFATGGGGEASQLAWRLGLLGFPNNIDVIQLLMALINIGNDIKISGVPNPVEVSVVQRVLPTLWDHLTDSV